MKLKSSILSVIGVLAMTAGVVSPVFAAVSLSVTFAPPALPVYEQPVSPGPNYLWTPGYWSWDGEDYYWVPGTWVLAPQPGYLWTPGYWGWRDGLYVFNEGYWGPTIGFYGGIHYGFGYTGHGYVGGRWQGDHFFYNSAVTRVDETTVKNVYTSNVVNNVTVNNVSYNGGTGGVRAEATAEEKAAAREKHLPPVATQRQHAEEARNQPQLRASVNHGRPSIAATQKPNEFSGRSVVAARSAGSPTHARDIPPATKQPLPKTGDAAVDKENARKQDEMYARQEQEKRALAAKQEADHQRLAAEKENEKQQQEMEKEHQRQTQELQKRHEQEREQVKRKRPKPEEEHRG